MGRYDLEDERHSVTYLVAWERIGSWLGSTDPLHVFMALAEGCKNMLTPSQGPM